MLVKKVAGHFSLAESHMQTQTRPEQCRRAAALAVTVVQELLRPEVTFYISLNMKKSFVHFAVLLFCWRQLNSSPTELTSSVGFHVH